MKRKGITTMSLVLSTILISTMTFSAIKYIIPKSNIHKQQKEEYDIKKYKYAVMTDTMLNNRLTDEDGFKNIVEEIKDEYGRNLFYEYDKTLTEFNTENKEEGICSVENTSIEESGKFVAFKIISSGKDGIKGNKDDIEQKVYLRQLQEEMGCVGSELEILTDNIPDFVINNDMSFTIYGQGGKKDYEWKYNIKEGYPLLPYNVDFGDIDEYEIKDTYQVENQNPINSGKYEIDIYLKDYNGKETVKKINFNINKDGFVEDNDDLISFENDWNNFLNLNELYEYENDISDNSVMIFDKDKKIIFGLNKLNNEEKARLDYIQEINKEDYNLNITEFKIKGNIEIDYKEDNNILYSYLKNSNNYSDDKYRIESYIKDNEIEYKIFKNDDTPIDEESKNIPIKTGVIKKSITDYKIGIEYFNNNNEEETVLSEYKTKLLKKTEDDWIKGKYEFKKKEENNRLDNLIPNQKDATVIGDEDTIIKDYMKINKSEEKQGVNTNITIPYGFVSINYIPNNLTEKNTIIDMSIGDKYFVLLKDNNDLYLRFEDINDKDYELSLKDVFDKTINGDNCVKKNNHKWFRFNKDNCETEELKKCYETINYNIEVNPNISKKEKIIDGYSDGKYHYKKLTDNKKSFKVGSGYTKIEMKTKDNQGYIGDSDSRRYSLFVSKKHKNNLNIGSNWEEIILSDENDIVEVKNGSNKIDLKDGEDKIKIGNAKNTYSLIEGDKGNKVIEAGDSWEGLKLGEGNDIVKIGKGGINYNLGKGDDNLNSCEGSKLYSIIDGGDGNDYITIGKNWNKIIGGDGEDTVVLHGDKERYKITKRRNYTIVEDKENNNFKTVLVEVENINFNGSCELEIQKETNCPIPLEEYNKISFEISKDRHTIKLNFIKHNSEIIKSVSKTIDKELSLLNNMYIGDNNIEYSKKISNNNSDGVIDNVKIIEKELTEDEKIKEMKNF